MNWSPLLITFKLAIVVTLVLFVISVPLGYWLAYTKSKFKPVIETFVSMPLVLPPTVLGFYLLIAFSPNAGFGKWLSEVFDLQLVFTFGGLVFASILYSLPFMVHPIQSGFSGLSSSIRDAARLMGKTKWQVLSKVLLPAIRPSIITGIVLSFAHTIGEFGVVLMIGGSIPGQTRVASIAIYDQVEALNYNVAHQYSIILFIISFVILLFVYTRHSKWAKSITP